ncbi:MULTISPECIES: hypothetical protein [unclassified Mycolicibacterium]|uniref:hypothetical protein n=1 Tax=unclassified Mycolicibacterium TaxID=2636767 RepID=UPI002EDAEC96
MGITSSEQVHIPPGPADTRYTLASLARLALMKGALALFDDVVKLLDPRNADDVFYRVQDLEDHVRYLNDMAAVLEFESDGGSLNLGTHPLENPELGPAIRAWRKTVERPWCVVDDCADPEYAAPRIDTNLPDGASDPDGTCDELEDWCEQHLPNSNGTSVSSIIQLHTAETEAASVARHGHFLETSEDATPWEWAAHRARMQRISAVAFGPDPGVHTSSDLLGFDEIPPSRYGGPVSDLWSEIAERVNLRDQQLGALMARRPMSVTKDVVVLGDPTEAGTDYLNRDASHRIVSTAIAETVGCQHRVRVASVAAFNHWQNERAKPPF